MDNIESLAGLKQAVLTLLGSDARFRGIRLREEYPGQKEYPLRETTLVSGIDSIEAAWGALGGYYGESGAGVQTGSGTLITMRLDIYLPKNEPVKTAHTLYEAVCELLLLSGVTPGVKKISCGAPEYDSGASAMRLPVKAELNAVMGAYHETVSIGDFYIKRSELHDNNQ